MSEGPTPPPEIVIDPPPSEEEWEYAKIRADPDKRFVLWMVNDGICRTPTDFHIHFAPTESIDYEDILKSLHREGYLSRVRGKYRVAAKGRAILGEPYEPAKKNAEGSFHPLPPGHTPSDPQSHTVPLSEAALPDRADGLDEVKGAPRLSVDDPRKHRMNKPRHRMNKRAPRSSVDDPRKQLTEAARKERKRFLEVYSRHLEQIRQISLNVLVLGKNPSTTSPIANIRKEIVQVLRERGDNAMFSDYLQIDPGQGLTERAKEFAMVSPADLIIAVIEDSPGAVAELSDLFSNPEVAPKMFLMIPKAYAEGYSAQGAIASLGREHHGNVFWYTPEEFHRGMLVTAAVACTERFREIKHRALGVQGFWGQT
ncbi:MAG: hypothetical protein WA746_17920 [Isosphaeraceae bacterium]